MNGTTLDTILRRLARERGTKVALRYGDAVLTYAELDARACRVANGLAAARRISNFLRVPSKLAP